MQLIDLGMLNIMITWQMSKALCLLLLITVGLCSYVTNSQAMTERSGAATLDVSPTVRQAFQQNPELAEQVQSALAGKPIINPAAPPSIHQQLAQQTTTQALPGGQLPSTANAQQPLPLASGSSVGQQVTGTNTGSVTNPVTGNLNPQWQRVVKKQAFKQVEQEAFPLTPSQIKRLRNKLDDTQRAAATAPYSRTPRPTSTSLIVNLAPGSTPPVIRLNLGFVSSLVFVDSTGAPWPIDAYDIGNPQAFNIKWDKKSNTLMIQARAPYTYGNMAIKLVDLNTPVMLTLVPGQRVIDYRVDLRVPGMGPNAKPVISGSSLPDEADARLLNVLDGVPPEGSKTLDVKGADAKAWLAGDAIFLRTRFKVLSPAWLATMSSADGMNAYKMAKTSLILLSRYGKTTQLHIKGY